MMRVNGQCLVAILLLIGCSQALGDHAANHTTTPGKGSQTVTSSKTYTFVDAKASSNLVKANPMDAKIGPKTIWYWCGFKSMKGLAVSIETTQTVIVLEQRKEDVKKNINQKGWSVAPGSGKKTYAAFLLPYDRCVVVRNEATSVDGYAVIQIEAKPTQDKNLILILAAICAGAVIVFTCFLWCMCKLCKRIFRRSKAKEYGRNTV